MRYAAPCFAILAAWTPLAVSVCPGATVPPEPGWSLVWHDEFDGAVVDTSTWELLERRDSYNNEKQYYLPEQISQADGLLRITSTDEPLDGKAYRSGRMWSWAEQTYGRWEVRARVPTTQGMWPAIWLLPRTAPWPTGGEIDIMENRGSEPDRVSRAYDWGSSVAAHQYVHHTRRPFADGQPVSFPDGFSTFAVEWEEDRIRYFVDDVWHFTVDSATAPYYQGAR